jgi:sulfur relay (sulfurtransferase) DsrF/TusC family protein
MPPSIVTVIREDPRKTHRAVEALRIALGLSTGENPLTVVLLGEAPRLLAEETDEIQDLDILEKYLPSFKQLKTLFLVPPGAKQGFALDEEFEIQEVSSEEISALVVGADRVLAF